MSRAVAVLLAAALLAAPAPARAQGRWQEQVRNQIEQASKILRQRGFARADTYDGKLHNDASESVTLSLRAGRQYAILAVCDSDCTDIDLHIYGSNDKEIDSDIEDDDKPEVMVTPASDGRFRIKVTMAQCSTSPCYYGLGLFAK